MPILKSGIPGVELYKPFGILVEPAGEELVLMARATGFQIYVCRPDANGKPGWTLKPPNAELFNEQREPIGKHFGGPTWRLNDGSRVTGKTSEWRMLI